MSNETFELIDRLRRAGKQAAMATLVRAAGTTPRKEGTKMFVGEEGDVFGSVTIGGCVDARVIQQAGEVLAASAPSLLTMQLGDDEAWEIGLTCGGVVDVFIEPVSDTIMEVYEAARVEWQAGRPVALATVLSGSAAGSRVLIDAAGAVHGTAPDAVIETLGPEIPGMLRGQGGSRTIPSGADLIYLEVLRPPPTLLIFGAGAVAIPLVTFAKSLGYRTVVIDGRTRFATRERFPEADDIRVGIASEIAGEMNPGPTTAIVLVAHDYKIDVPVLKKALSTDSPYIGLLGSRRRGAAILEMLREEGVAADQLSRVRVPIGLDLGGETSAEIALSIISEVVAVMRGRSAAPLSRPSSLAVS